MHQHQCLSLIRQETSQWNIETQHNYTHKSVTTGKDSEQMAIKNKKYLIQLQFSILLLYAFMLASCSPLLRFTHSLVQLQSHKMHNWLYIHTNKLAPPLSSSFPLQFETVQLQTWNTLTQISTSQSHLLLAPPLSKVLNSAWQWINLPHSAYSVFSLLSTLCLSPPTSHTAHTAADPFKRSTTTIHKSSRHQLWWR